MNQVASDHSRRLAKPFSGGKFEWFTQYPIQYKSVWKFPDIVLSVDACPALIVENKISAGFTQHNSLEKTDVANQLQIYGRWLANANKDPIVQRSEAVILLTHQTPPPVDFLDFTSDYGVANRSVCLWNQVYRWLRDVGNFSDRLVAALAGEFAEFLRQNDMGIDDPGKREFEIAKPFYAVAKSKIEGSMDQLREFARSRLEKRLVRPKEDYLKNELGYEGHRIWQFWWLNEPGFGSYWYLAWGVVFSGAEWLDDLFPNVPNRDLASFAVGSTRHNLPLQSIPKDRRPQGWHWPIAEQKEPLALVTRPLEEIYSGKLGFTEEFKRWLSPLLDAGFEVLARMKDVSAKKV